MNRCSRRTKNLFYIVFVILSFFSCAKEKTSEAVFETKVQDACQSNTLSNRYIVAWEDGHFSVEQTPEGFTDEEFRKKFVDVHLDQIQKVDRDYRIQTKKINLEQKSLLIANSNPRAWGADKIEASAVWQQGYRGQNVIVGVVDGFVDKSHSQLENNVVIARQFNSQINNSDKNIHGTHVTGIIAANSNTGLSTGIAPEAHVISGQFLDNDGAGSLGDAILAMNFVAAEGAKIINMSWGGAPCVESLKIAAERLSNQGVLLVTAAGNESTNLDSSPNYPAAFKLLNQINVAATTIEDLFPGFTNYGFRSVNVAAPGEKIFSTLPNNSYGELSGTSMAAPMVSGAAALLWSAYPEATTQQIKSALYRGVDRRPNLVLSTQGRINVRKSLDALREVLLSR